MAPDIGQFLQGARLRLDRLKMNDRLLRAYHRLPSPIRSGVASLRGYRLRNLRYGPESERLASEALERDYWNTGDWESYRTERLQFILNHAATQVPYYRELWAARRRSGERAWEDLDNWPVLEKEEVRRNPRAFIADNCDRRRLFRVHTSGTTGKPLDLWHSEQTSRFWYALFEARCRQWNGLSRNDRWAILGGQLVTPIKSRRPPFWVWNGALNQLYMSSYHLAPDLIPYYVEALRRHCIKYLYGYTSALYEIALNMIATGTNDIHVSAVLTNAEPVFDYQRSAIERAFNCTLIETYGMAEMIAGATACPSGALHFWPEVAYVESLANGQTGAEHETVFTGLINPDMPLIKYRIGDRVVFRTPNQTCECGRSLPIVDAIEGRTDDLLYTADGRRVGRLDPIFKADLGLKEAQIVQETLNLIRVRYVAGSDFSPRGEEAITNRVRDRLGDVTVVLEELDRIPRGANGKFRAVVCSIQPR